MMSLSIELIKLIDNLRYYDVRYALSKLDNLYYQARMNKIGFYFLSLLHENGFLPRFLAEDYFRLEGMHKRIMEKFVQVSSDLDSLGDLDGPGDFYLAVGFKALADSHQKVFN
ncbi:MAG: hypothetical protein DRN00_04550 [Thermoplasmata archaeon]|nr:MAG: hypothetical protein DRN00_04550 [Thermoplasmata archaeon]